MAGWGRLQTLKGTEGWSRAVRAKLDGCAFRGEWGHEDACRSWRTWLHAGGQCWLCLGSAAVEGGEGQSREELERSVGKAVHYSPHSDSDSTCDTGPTLFAPPLPQDVAIGRKWKSVCHLVSPFLKTCNSNDTHTGTALCLPVTMQSLSLGHITGQHCHC